MNLFAKKTHSSLIHEYVLTQSQCDILFVFWLVGIAEFLIRRGWGNDEWLNVPHRNYFPRYRRMLWGRSTTCNWPHHWTISLQLPVWPHKTDLIILSSNVCLWTYALCPCIGSKPLPILRFFCLLFTIGKPTYTLNKSLNIRGDGNIYKCPGMFTLVLFSLLESHL